MQYMILNYTDPNEFANADELQAAALAGVWQVYTRALIEAGVLVAGNALHPAHTATTLRVRGEAREIEDGPYAASKEQLGGYYIIEVPDLDTALEWAAKNPAATSGAVEVRPVAVQAPA